MVLSSAVFGHTIGKVTYTNVCLARLSTLPSSKVAAGWQARRDAYLVTHDSRSITHMPLASLQSTDDYCTDENRQVRVVAVTDKY